MAVSSAGAMGDDMDVMPEREMKVRRKAGGGLVGPVELHASGF